MRGVLSFMAIFISYAFVSSLGTIINVPADYPTIQQGINASVNSDTVLVQPGTYVENINFDGHNIVLGSLFLTTGDTSYIFQTIIDGDSLDTVVTFNSGEDSIAIITGFTIKNGSADRGGGIYCNESNPTISNNSIIENSALGYTGGGGICCWESHPVINNNNISGNLANCQGGGIYCHSSDPIIGNNTISGNFAYQDGGGIYCAFSNPVINNNLIDGNSAYSFCGGGIICVFLSNPIVNNNIISNNSAGSAGGGIACSGLSNPTISNNTISRNSSSLGYGGGGISCHESNPTISNSTLSQNWGNWGGGINCWESSPVILNTILWDDSAGWEGPEIYIDSASNPIFTYCDIQGGWTGQGNIDIVPLFRDAENGDFHLMSTTCGDSADSPCIDVGDPNILDSLLDCSWGLGGPRSDMGAYGGGDSVITGIFENMPSLSDRFTLLQNYPNPFNAQTTVRFVLPQSQEVELAIYDLLGRRIRTLLNERKQAGVHTVTFDASLLSSGVYFYRLQTGDYAETRRMILLK